MASVKIGPGRKLEHKKAAVPELPKVERVAALAVTGLGRAAAACPLVKAPLSALHEFFVLKNETGMVVPDAYRPDADSFGAYARKLARAWGRVVLELYRILGLEGEFGIGFLFAEETEAEFEQSAQFGSVYYLNPAVITRQEL